MSDLRTAAQQALEAMEYTGLDVGKFNRVNAACAALRAVLAQPTPPPEAGAEAELERLRAENAALRREAHSWWTAARDALQLADLVRADERKCIKGEPVAWMLTDPQNPRLRYLEWDQQARPYRGEWIRTPLVVGLADAPPERKHYALADLLKDMQPGDMPRADEWDAAPPIGQEEGPKR